MIIYTTTVLLLVIISVLGYKYYKAQNTIADLTCKYKATLKYSENLAKSATKNKVPKKKGV